MNGRLEKETLVIMQTDKSFNRYNVYYIRIRDDNH